MLAGNKEKTDKELVWDKLTSKPITYKVKRSADRPIIYCPYIPIMVSPNGTTNDS